MKPVARVRRFMRRNRLKTRWADYTHPKTSIEEGEHEGPARDAMLLFLSTLDPSQVYGIDSNADHLFVYYRSEQ